MNNLPIIITDSREQTPLKFRNLETEVSTLQSGDYSAKGLEHVFAIERKSVADLTGSLTSGRERFERELHRLRGFDTARLLIVGENGIDPRLTISQHSYRSKVSPNSVLSSLAAIEMRYGIPVVFADSPAHASLIVEKLAYYALREAHKRAGLKPQATPPFILANLSQSL